MKALIISDEQNVIEQLSSKLKADGYDIIVYRWLLKALDNVEEIQPDFIVLSASEYPRQWKTLASYVSSGIGGKNVKFCLFNSFSLSDEDKTKADQLNVEYWEDEKKNNDDYSIILTHPLYGNFIYGTAKKISDSIFECKIDRSGFMIKQQIKFVSVRNKDGLFSFSSEVQSFQKEMVLIKVIDYYEK